MHCGIYGKAGRSSLAPCEESDGRGRILSDLLRDWVPRDLFLSMCVGLFVTGERLSREIAQRCEEGWGWGRE
jgi:hypothetical protein